MGRWCSPWNVYRTSPVGPLWLPVPLPVPLPLDLPLGVPVPRSAILSRIAAAVVARGTW